MLDITNYQESINKSYNEMPLTSIRMTSIREQDKRKQQNVTSVGKYIKKLELLEAEQQWLSPPHALCHTGFLVLLQFCCLVSSPDSMIFVRGQNRYYLGGKIFLTSLLFTCPYTFSTISSPFTSALSHYWWILFLNLQCLVFGIILWQNLQC